jgi:hypothetical protein
MDILLPGDVAGYISSFAISTMRHGKLQGAMETLPDASGKLAFLAGRSPPRT